MDSRGLTKFKEYLRINTAHPNPNYKDAISFLIEYADELLMNYIVLEIIQGKPILLITIEGKQPHLPSILLNSHMDVVPVYESEWKYPPFAAITDIEGNIFGRGSQDMKSVGIQFMESMARLKSTLNRTVHITFMPEEEIGGKDGMQEYIKTKEFWKLNIGVVIDEGLANPLNEISVFYGERTPWCNFFY